jgi:NADH dehydrogenase
MILVVGATGILGLETCRQLRARGRPVRALVRGPSPGADTLRSIGAETVVGDLRSPDSLVAACRGVDTIVSTATAMGSKDKQLTLRAVDGDGQQRLLATAKAGGVQRFIYVSASPNLAARAPLVRYKRAMESAIRASGLRWTILQPSVFMEVWLSSLLGWDHAAGRAMIFGDGTQPMSWISAADVAQYVVQSVEDARLENRELAVGGPAAISPNDVVSIFERASHRAYKVKRVPRPLLTLLGPIVARFNEGAGSGMLMGAQSAASGDVIDSTLQKSIGLPLATVEEYARRVTGT